MGKDPEVMQYIGDGSIFHWTRQIARNKFREKLERPDYGQIGTVSVCRQADSQYLGWCAISFSKFLNTQELGYRFCRDAWGCGYATEAATALLTQAERVIALNRIMACVHPDNSASINVLEKLSFSYEYSKLSKPAGVDLLVYQFDKGKAHAATPKSGGT